MVKWLETVNKNKIKTLQHTQTHKQTEGERPGERLRNTYCVGYFLLFCSVLWFFLFILLACFIHNGPTTITFWMSDMSRTMMMWCWACIRISCMRAQQYTRDIALKSNLHFMVRTSENCFVFLCICVKRLRSTEDTIIIKNERTTKLKVSYRIVHRWVEFSL